MGHSYNGITLHLQCGNKGSTPLCVHQKIQMLERFTFTENKSEGGSIPPRFCKRGRAGARQIDFSLLVVSHAS
jgi:hypothetical protein